MSYRQTIAKLGEMIVDVYFRFIRTVLAVFQVLNNICYILGGLLCFGFALYIEADLAPQAPIWNIMAFLVAWIGIALECDAFAQLEARDTRIDPFMHVGFGVAVASAEIGAVSMNMVDGSCEFCPGCCGHDSLNDNVPSEDWLEELLKAPPPPMPRTPH